VVQGIIVVQMIVTVLEMKLNAKGIMEIGVLKYLDIYLLKELVKDQKIGHIHVKIYIKTILMQLMESKNYKTN